MTAIPLGRHRRPRPRVGRHMRRLRLRRAAALVERTLVSIVLISLYGLCGDLAHHEYVACGLLVLALSPFLGAFHDHRKGDRR